MPMPSGVVWKLTVGGAIGGVDSWSIGIWADLPDGVPSQGNLDSLTSDLLGDFKNDVWDPASTGFKAQNSNGVDLSKAKSYVYSAGNLVMQSAASITAVPGTASTARPAYTALAFTLHTASFGRSSRGRVYLPATGVGTNTATLQFTLSQACADQMASWLNTWNGNPYFAAHPVVLSQKHGTTAHITSVSVNTLPDTQRGRMSKATPTSTFSHTVT